MGMNWSSIQGKRETASRFAKVSRSVAAPRRRQDHPYWSQWQNRPPHTHRQQVNTGNLLGHVGDFLVLNVEDFTCFINKFAQGCN
jgi:hypothetical protein